LFSLNRGDSVLPVRLADSRKLPEQKLPRLYATASALDSGGVILKVVNSGGEAAEAEIRMEGAAPTSGEATVLAGQPDDINTISDPTKLTPTPANFLGVGATFTHASPPHSLTILRLK